MVGDIKGTGSKGDGNSNKSVKQATATKRSMTIATRMAGDKEGNTMARVARAMATAMREAGKRQLQSG